MVMTLRSGLRSRPIDITNEPVVVPPTPSTFPLSVQFTSTPSPSDPISLYEPNSTTLPGLTTVHLRLLRAKQSRLQASFPPPPPPYPSVARLATQHGPHIENTLAATLLFAQPEAGTAVCIDAAGWVLTCAHCFGETPAEWRVNRRKWALFHTGVAVQLECRAWDPTRDLALAKIIAVEMDRDMARSRHGIDQQIPRFTFVPLPPVHNTPSLRAPIVCIGQPGAEDLESSVPRSSGYFVVELSEGRLRGMVAGADPQVNSEIGSLMHDAWTYWGHSGAPLVCATQGVLLGLHSSWDDKTAMRHGVPLVAIREFLGTHLPSSLP